MKLLFLDVDGVLNRYHTKKLTPMGFIDIEDDKLELINDLIKNTNAKIILSSTWSKGFIDINNENIDTPAAKDLLYLVSKFDDFGLSIFDYIVQVPNEHRGEKIYDWIINHNQYNIESILILDDDSSWQPYGSFALKVSIMQGLNKKQVIRGTKILNTHSFPGFQEKLQEKEKHNNR